MSRKKLKPNSYEKKYTVIPAILSFIIPIVTCITLFWQKNIFPFGENCILNSDMYDQYYPFYLNYAHILKEGLSMQYNPNMGLGSGFIPHFAYYLASPVNILLKWWPDVYILEFMTYTIVLRIGLSGLFFFLFLNYRFKLSEDKEWSMSKTENLWAALVMSCAYAMSGYVAAYDWQIMWMDVVMLAPIVCLGLIMLVREQKSAIYYCSLAYCIFSNYYISMMLCIFLVGYAAVLLLEEKRGIRYRIGSACRFALASLLAGGTAAALLIPTIGLMIAGTGASSVEAFPKQMEWYFNIFQELSRTMSFAQVYAGGEYWPNIYAGVFTSILLVLYVFNKKIAIKAKLPRILMLVFLLISFMNNILSYLWHGLRYPVFFPSRQSFLYIFLALVIAMEVYIHREGIRYKELGITFVLLLIVVILSGVYTEEEVTSYSAFLRTAVFIFLYLLIYALRMAVAEENKLFLGKTLLILAVSELVFNLHATGFAVVSRTEYMSNQHSLEKLVESAGVQEQEETLLSQRICGVNSFIRNEGELLNIRAASEFNTFLNVDISKLYRGLGMKESIREYSTSGITPIVSGMFNIQYVISKNNWKDDFLRKKIAQEGEYNLYENTYCLPVGYLIPGEMDSLQTEIFRPSSYMTEKYAYSYSEKGQDVSLVFQQPGHYFAKFLYGDRSGVEIEIGDTGKVNLEGTEYNQWIDLGYVGKEEPIWLRNALEHGYKPDELRWFRVNEEAFQDTLSQFEEASLQFTEATDERLVGYVTAHEKGTLVFAIPYEPGWRIKIDGRDMPLDRQLDALLGIEIPKGEHSFELFYETPLGNIGKIISLISIGTACILLILEGFLNKKHNKQ